MDDEDRRWLFGEVVSTVADNGGVATMSAAEPRCHRCGRIRESDQVAVVDACGLIQWCVDKDECDEYQLQQSSGKP